jgi:hypothetical protein
MKNDWKGKVTNLVQTESKMVNHSYHTHSSKISLQRWKIPKLEEFGKNQLVNEILNLFYYLIGLIFVISH